MAFDRMTHCFSHLASKMKEIIADIVKRERIEGGTGILSLCLGFCIDIIITIVEEVFNDVKNQFSKTQFQTCLCANLSPEFLIAAVPITLHLYPLLYISCRILRFLLSH